MCIAKTRFGDLVYRAVIISKWSVSLVCQVFTRGDTSKDEHDSKNCIQYFPRGGLDLILNLVYSKWCNHLIIWRTYE